MLCAVSGGADSLLLCEALRLLARRLSLDLVVAHIDHGLRVDSAADAARVEAFACERGLPYVSRRVAVRRVGSVEAAARDARLAALAELARESGATHVALGHTASDRAETLLLFLARGAGRRGLGSMAPRQERDGLVWVRPLCELTRAQVRVFAEARALPFRDDPMNEELALSRNLLRAQVLPRLDALYPGVDARLAELSEQLAGEDAFLDEEVRRRLDPRLGAEGLVIAASAIERLPEALRTRALRLCLADARGDARGLTRAHILLVQGLVRPGARSVTLPGCEVSRDGEWLRFRTPTPTPSTAGVPPEPLACQRVLGPGAYSPRAGINFEVNLLQDEVRVQSEGPLRPGRGRQVAGRRDEAVFDPATLERPLWIRGPRPGDRIRLEGGGRQKIFDLFTNARIPRSQRASWPILADDDEVLWVPGLRQSARGRPSAVSAPTLHILARGLLLAGAYANDVETCAVVPAYDRKGEP